MDNTYYTFYYIEDFDLQYSELVSFCNGKMYYFTPFYIGAYSYKNNSSNYAISTEYVNKYI